MICTTALIPVCAVAQGQLCRPVRPGGPLPPDGATVLGTARQLGISTAALMRGVCAQGLANKPVTVCFPIPAQKPQRLA